MLSSLPVSDAQNDIDRERMELSLRDISTRIARLAIALGMPLQTEENLRLATILPEPIALESERRAIEDRRAGHRTASGLDRRVRGKREELRGLIVLRYGIEKSLVDSLGVVVARQVMETVEIQLQHEGFQPGADGIDLAALPHGD